ncbi:alpha-N-arabinofuranosidase [Aliifodinibius salicampi]|uniref:non-reducing end alpha-L-arabinofuranosidase n=1 Tax=Fodinibius salicampi TaxID=1920655 RepID=A0ABT3PU01_9BACT|nr:alpha-N-arabinofuranosidase [Fodinibius salicampi]MCW9711333.1 alpha-N-arabinofuranosidase [Fodinibius salicampi]
MSSLISTLGMRKLLLTPLIILLLGCFTVTAQNSMVITADQPQSTISEHIYGQFSEHLGTGMYGGLWVGEDSEIPNTDGFRNDVIKALKELQVPNLRWPGGCFADEYNWRDGIGPRDERPVRINTHWGMVEEKNQVGTHEFMRLTELIDTEPYISANVGSGTPREMANWIEYMTFDGNSTLANLRRENGQEEAWEVKFWGIGNESWGCGGNMQPDYYADLFRRYATFAKDYSGNELYKIASGFSNENYGWTETVVEEAGAHMDAISLHYYTLPTGDWGNKGPSKDFGEDMYFSTLKRGLRMDEFVTQHSNRLDKFDPEKRITLAVDEWGVWTDPLEGTNPGFLQQQNSIRDALVASTTLDILNKHSDRVRIGNIAQTVNVLQAMVLTDGEQMLKTPTYHVFDFYTVHHNTKLLPLHLDAEQYEYEGENIPSISATASKSDDGTVNLTVTNLHASETKEVTADIRGVDLSSVSNARLLTGDAVDAINTFDNPDNVSPTDFNDYTLDGNNLTLRIPSKSVIVLRIN